MAELAVVDASPLILLAKAELLDLLQLAAPRLVVPEPVAEEVRAYPNDAAVQAIATDGRLTVVPTGSAPPIVLAWQLGAGESAVLSYALTHPGAEAILDDLAGRRCAASLGIPVRGTLGLVLIAKRRGVVEQASPLVDQLRRVGMYLSDRLVDSALSMVGE